MNALRLKVPAALFAALALAFGPFTTPTAAAADTASVSGTITGPDGAALAGVREVSVLVQRWSDEDGGHWGWGGAAWLGSDDFRYAVDDLKAGLYRVSAEPSGGNYVAAYSGEFTLSAGDARTEVNVALKQGASVSGRVTGPGGAALVDVSGVSVDVQQWSDDDGGHWSSAAWAKLDEGESDYSVSALGAGTFRVQASPTGGNYRPTYSAEFTLTEGQKHTGMDVALTRGASVAGRITGPGGAALVGVDLVSVSVQQSHEEDGFTSWDAVGEVWLDAGESDYTVAALPAGSYRISVYASGGNYIRVSTAEFTLAEGQTLTGKDITLAIGASVTGKITGPGGAALTGVGEVVVVVEKLVVRDGHTDWVHEGRTSLLSGQSTYVFKGLEAGTYRVNARVDNRNYLEAYSTEFTLVARQARTGVNIALPRAASVAGKVTGPRGAALIGVDNLRWELRKKVMREGHAQWDFVDRTWLTSGQSTFMIDRLPAGVYRLTMLASDSDNEPADNYLETTSAEFTLTAGQARTGWTVALTAAASVSGTIAGPDGAELSGTSSVQTRLQERQADGSWESQGAQKKWARWDDPTYSIRRLAAGEYRLQARSFDGNYATVHSAAFTLAVGQARTGFDVALSPGATLDGTVTGPNGALIPDIEGESIVAQRIDHSLWDETLEEQREWVSLDLRETAVRADSTFQMQGLAPGTYVLSMKAGRGHGDFYSAPLTVTSGQALTGFKVELEPAGSVRATVLPRAGVKYCWVTVSRRVTVDGQTRWLSQNEIPWNGGSGTPRRTECGEFALGQLSAGTYRLSVENPFLDIEGASYFTLGVGESTTSVEVEFGVDDLGASLPGPKSLGHIARPTISGSTSVGSELRASSGTWTQADVSVTYQWSRSGTPIEGATQSRHMLTTDDLGKRLSVTVTASKTGYASAVAVSAYTAIVVPMATKPPAVAKKPAVLALKAKAGRSKATLTLTVTAAGVPASQINGQAVVYLKNKKVKTVTVRNGKAIIKLAKQKRGKRTYKVTYLGNAKVKAASRSIRITIK